MRSSSSEEGKAKTSKKSSFSRTHSRREDSCVKENLHTILEETETDVESQRTRRNCLQRGTTRGKDCGAASTSTSSHKHNARALILQQYPQAAGGPPDVRSDPDNFLYSKHLLLAYRAEMLLGRRFTPRGITQRMRLKGPHGGSGSPTTSGTSNDYPGQTSRCVRARGEGIYFNPDAAAQNVKTSFHDSRKGGEKRSEGYITNDDLLSSD
ncbi:unnamed protein product, partial [Amoebophrya sp. A120]|eukprot:GSA120T00013691001.1